MCLWFLVQITYPNKLYLSENVPFRKFTHKIYISKFFYTIFNVSHIKNPISPSTSLNAFIFNRMTVYFEPILF